MGPIDYSIDVASPVQAALQGYGAGAAIRDDQAKQQQLQAAQAQQAQMQSDLRAFSQIANPTGADYARLTTRYPQLSENFKRSWEMLKPEQQQGEMRHATQVYAATLNGRPDVAQQLLRDRAAALRNSGDEAKAKHAETMAELVRLNPSGARNTIGVMLSSVMDPDKFATTFSTLGDQGRAADKAPAEQRKAEAEASIKGVEAANARTAAALSNANIRSQIEDRAGKLALDRDTLQSNIELELHKLGQKATQLDDGAKKLINDATVSAVSADQSANQMVDLAGRLEKEDAGYGGATTASEWLKRATGNQDALSSMRGEYARLRNSFAVKNLPPGAASDTDVKMAMAGFPPENADTKVMAQFLRGMAKMQQFDAASNSARAEWVNAVGHLGKPKADIEVEGIKVPAGSTFLDFSRQFVQRKAEERTAAQATQQVQGRGYMRFANPPAGNTGGATGAY